MCLYMESDKLIPKFIWKYKEPGKTISSVNKIGRLSLRDIKSYSLVVSSQGWTNRPTEDRTQNRPNTYAVPFSVLWSKLFNQWCWVSVISIWEEKKNLDLYLHTNIKSSFKWTVIYMWKVIKLLENNTEK